MVGSQYPFNNVPFRMRDFEELFEFLAVNDLQNSLNVTQQLLHCFAAVVLLDYFTLISVVNGENRCSVRLFFDLQFDQSLAQK